MKMMTGILTGLILLALLGPGCTESVNDQPESATPTNEPTTEGVSDGGLSSSECYEMKGSTELDAIVGALCETCPAVLPSDVCDWSDQRYPLGQQAWLTGCLGVPLEPGMYENLLEDCEAVREGIGPWAMECGDEWLTDRILLWDITYCPEEDEPPTPAAAERGEPGDCYVLKALIESDTAVLSLCEVCPDVTSSDFCDAFHETYEDGKALWIAGCRGVSPEPTVDELISEECENLRETLLPLTMRCGDQLVKDMVLLWELTYCSREE